MTTKGAKYIAETEKILYIRTSSVFLRNSLVTHCLKDGNSGCDARLKRIACKNYTKLRKVMTNDSV